MGKLLLALSEIDAERPTEAKDQLELMLELEKVAKLAKSIATELSIGLARSLKERGMKAEPVGRYVIEWKSSATRRWDNGPLLARVLQYADEQGCEVHALLQKVAAIGYWRVTELKKLGFDVDHWCDTTWSEPQVIVVDGGSNPDHQG